MRANVVDEHGSDVQEDDFFMVTLKSLPMITFKFEQFQVGGLNDTGGALWLTDRVMAEYVAADPTLSLPCCQEHVQEPHSNGIALVLGCGASPLSGLVAHTLGWEVVLTDLSVVVPQTLRNVEHNSEILKRLPETCPPTLLQSGFERLSVVELPWGNLDALAVSLSKASTIPPPGRMLVLCSDCVVKRCWHVPLLETIAHALCSMPMDRAEALVAFEHRDPFVEHAFLKQAKSDAFGFEVSKVSLEDVIERVDWPERVRERMLVNTSDYERFLLYRLTLPCELGSTMLQRKLWWEDQPDETSGEECSEED